MGRRARSALIAFALSVVAGALAIMSPATGVAESPSDESESAETIAQLIERLSTEGMAELRHLTTNYSPRRPFTEEEVAAGDYIEGKLLDMGGYTVTAQPFRVPGQEDEVSTLSLLGPPARDVRSQAVEGSAIGDVTAPVVAVGKALAGDIPDSGLHGKIALIERGSNSLTEKSRRVAESGAVGAIVYDSEARAFRNGQPFTAAPTASSIPMATIWQEDGKIILKSLAEGTEVRARLKVEDERWKTSRNIIAERAGTDSSAGVVVLGAHYDTLLSAQGASDNGTGVASLLVMAEEISGLELAHTVRFIFFGAEEHGLLGSVFYASEYSAYVEGSIIAMVEIGSLGSGRPAVSSVGTRVLTDWVTGTFAPHNSLDVRYWSPVTVGGDGCFSDFCRFNQILGVPTIHFHGDDLSVSNTYRDVIDRVDPSIMGTQMAIALELVRQAPDIAPRPPAPEPDPPEPPSPPFAAQIIGPPERHDGRTGFFLILHFNRQPDRLGKRTVWDEVLDIGGAEVTVNRFLRYAHWGVSVQPTHGGDVTIRLPVRECTDAASVCSEGVPLSAGLSVRVRGPDSTDEGTPNTPATGNPAIDGSPVVGQTLTATTTGIADEDGMANASFAYRWLADDTDISGATSSTYTLSAAEKGKAIKVRVSFTDDGGNEEALTSAATATVAAANSPATGEPTISGTAQVGQTLTAGTTEVADSDGLANASFVYRWLADDVEIAGATGSTYSLVATDEGKAIKVRVSFTDDNGNEESLTSAATAAVAARHNSAATGAPSVSGTAQVGETLTADTSGIADDDGLTTATYTYQWLADDTDISGARSSTYTLTSAEQGKAVKVRVTFTDDAGNEESLTSAAAAAVTAQQPPPSPTNLEVTVNSDGHVVLSWDAPDDDAVTGYQVLRRRPAEGENSLHVYVSDTGSTATTYTDTNVTAGTQHVYRVKAINAAGVSDQSNYVNVTPQAPQAQQPPPSPANLEATVNADGHVVLTWDAPDDDSVTGYVILRRRPSEGENSLQVYVADTGSTATTYTDTNVTAGTQHVYRVKAINAAGVGGRSNYVNVTP